MNLDKFTNLPDSIYATFYNLAKFAYEGVINQKYIFEHQCIIEPDLGFMRQVTELFPNQSKVNYSYNFLHLSVQEFLGAYYVSTLEIPQQEQLLRRMCVEKHLQSMGRFLAGITKFEGLDEAILKEIIEQDCENKVPLNWTGKKAETTKHLTSHAFQLLYESGNAMRDSGQQSILCRILDSNHSYGCPLTDLNPLFEFSTLGYCITHSNCKWQLHLGEPLQRMNSKERIGMLVQALESHSNLSNDYCIEAIVLRYDGPGCVEELLTMPENVLKKVQDLGITGNINNLQPLPQCLPELIPTMSSLHQLALGKAIGAVEAKGSTVVHQIVQAVVKTNTLKELSLIYCDIDDKCVTTLCKWLCDTSSPLEMLDLTLPSPDAIEMISTALTTNSTLKTLYIRGSAFSLTAMEVMCSMLTHNSTITVLKLLGCDINDDIIACLSKCLHINNTITTLDIRSNLIRDRGAVCVAKMLKINNTLQKVCLFSNKIDIEGQKALQEVKDAKKHIGLRYTDTIAEEKKKEEERRKKEEEEEEIGGGGRGRGGGKGAREAGEGGGKGEREKRRKKKEEEEREMGGGGEVKKEEGVKKEEEGIGKGEVGGGGEGGERGRRGEKKEEG